MRVWATWVKALCASVPLVALAVLWILFAPLQLGGQASYVVTSGHSMEPRFHSGDLAILRQADSYEVGDIVAYRDPKIGRVLHRIHAREGERFIMKGDNNDFLDPYQPAPSDVVGKLWLHVPKVGSWFARVQEPRNAALLAAAGGLILAAPVGVRAEQRRRRPLRRGGAGRNAPAPIRGGSGGGGGSAGVFGPLGQAALTVILVVGVASLLLGLLAYGRPTESSVQRPVPYTQSGTFAYSADASGTVYDGGAVTTGQPIFRALADTVTFTFDYALTSDTPAEISGTARLDAVLERADGWARTLPIAPEQPFSGAQATVSGVLKISDVQAQIDQFQRQAGLPEQSGERYTLSIVPAIAVKGTLAGAPLEDSFGPALTFQLDPIELQLADNGSGEGDPLRPSTDGAVTRSQVEPATLRLLMLRLDVATARVVAVAGIAAALLGGLVLGLLAWRGARADEPARIAARYGTLLITVRDSDLGAAGRVIDVASIEDLARVAEREGRMILHEERGGAHDYFVQDVDVTYRYQARPGLSAVARSSTMEVAP